MSLPVDLLREAKIYAARHDTTVTALVRKLLEERLAKETQILNTDEESLARVRVAGEKFLKLGPIFTGDPKSYKREDLYDRNWSRFLPKSDS